MTFCNVLLCYDCSLLLIPRNIGQPTAVSLLNSFSATIWYIGFSSIYWVKIRSLKRHYNGKVDKDESFTFLARINASKAFRGQRTQCQERHCFQRCVLLVNMWAKILINCLVRCTHVSWPEWAIICICCHVILHDRKSRELNGQTIELQHLNAILLEGVCITVRSMDMGEIAFWGEDDYYGITFFGILSQLFCR